MDKLYAKALAESGYMPLRDYLEALISSGDLSQGTQDMTDPTIPEPEHEDPPQAPNSRPADDDTGGAPPPPPPPPPGG